MNELNRSGDEFVKVVYCKDCKYRNTNKCPMIDFIPHPKTDKIYIPLTMNYDDGFCNYGERKGGEEK